MRLRFILLIFIALGMLFTGLNVLQETIEATSYSGRGQFTSEIMATQDPPSISQNDVLTNANVGGSRPAIPSYIGDGDGNDKQQFVDYIKNKLVNGDDRNKTGSQYIIATMVKCDPITNKNYKNNDCNPGMRPTANSQTVKDWEELVMNDMIKMNRTWKNVAEKGGVTFYSPTKNDVFSVENYPAGSREVLYFTVVGGLNSDYMVEILCGNPVNGLTLDLPHDVSLTPDAWVFTAGNPGNKQKTLDVAPGTQVVFENIVNQEGLGSDNDEFRYIIDDVNDNLPGGDASDSIELNKIGQRIPPNDPNNPDVIGLPRHYAYTIPTTARIGDQYCRRTKVINYQNLDYLKIKGNNPEKACVTVRITTVTPNTNVNQTVIAANQSVTFTHSATTSAYRDPPKQYRWTIFQWTNIAGSLQMKDWGNNTTNSNQTVNIKSFDYTAPADGSVTQVCQSLKLEQIPNQNADKSVTFGPESQYCVPVTGTVDRVAVIKAQPDGNTNVEPEQQGSGSVWGSTEVSRVPQLNASTKEWGYNEVASQRGPTKVSETVIEVPQPYATDTEPAKRQASNGHWDSINKVGSCPSGYFIDPGNNTKCRKYVCPSGWYGLTGADDTCYQDYNISYWWCNDPNQRSASGNVKTEGPTDSCATRKSKVICEDPSLPDMTYWDKSAPKQCPDTWKCDYPDNSPTRNTYVNRGQPVCEYRCYNAGGFRAALGASQYQNGFETWGAGDRNCYQPWHFQVKCTYNYSDTWGYKSPDNNTAQQTADVVPGNAGGTYCNQAFKYFGEYVGNKGCVSITVAPIISGNGTPYIDNGGSELRPGLRPDGTFQFRWGVAAEPATATQCFNTIARPYITFNKTDVHALYPGGNGAIDTFGNWVNGQYYGSGVGYAAFATNSITSSGFKTYTISGDDNKERVFSNTAYSPGGNAGGNFGATMGKTYTDLRDAMINGPTVCPSGNTISDFGAYTTPTVIYCGGQNITITANKSPWTIAIPNSVYVISPVINVSGNVTSLKSISLIAGQLNTCYNPAESGGCGNRLYISGSISADKINWQRAASSGSGGSGSSVYCLRPTRGSDLPSGAIHSCDRYTNPGELIDYSPEFSISAPPYQPSSGPTVGKYDSIRSLPPIY